MRQATKSLLITTFRFDRLRVAVAGVMITAGGMTDAAQAAVWNRTVDSLFNAGSSWVGNAVPTDVATFNNNFNGTATFNADATLTGTLPSGTQSLIFQNTSGAILFDLDGHTLTADKLLSVGTGATHKNNVTFVDGSYTHTTGNLLAVGAGSGSGHTLTFDNVVLATPSTGTSSVGSTVTANNNSLVFKNGTSVTAPHNFNVGTTASTVSGNSISFIDSSFSNTTSTSRGFNVFGGTLNITNSTVESAFIRLNAGATAASAVNFNSGHLTLREYTLGTGRSLTIGDGGATPAIYEFSTRSSTITAPGGVVINANGKLQNEGIVNANVSGVAGAKFGISVGAPTGNTFGGNELLGDLVTVNGNWDNTNIDVTLQLGDFPTQLAGDIANSDLFSIPYDHLDVNGTFTLGGTVTFDLATYVAPVADTYVLQVIGWDASAGLVAGMPVSFINGEAMSYEFRSDGLYLTVAPAAVPEPASLALVAMFSGGLLLRRRGAMA